MYGSHFRESSKKRTVAREVAKVEALYRESMLDDRVEQQRVDRAGRGAHGGIAMVMALTVSGAFPSVSMVAEACSCVSFEAMWSFQSFLVSRRGIKPAE